MNREKIDPLLLRVLHKTRETVPQGVGSRVPVFITVNRPLTMQALSEAHSLGLDLESDTRRLVVAELPAAAVEALSDKPWCVYLEADQSLPLPSDPV